MQKHSVILQSFAMKSVLKKHHHLSMRYRNWGTIIGSLDFNLGMFIFKWRKIKEQVEGNNAAIGGPWTLALSFGLMAKILTCLKISFKTPSGLSASLSCTIACILHLITLLSSKNRHYKGVDFFSLQHYFQGGRRATCECTVLSTTVIVSVI